MGFTEVLNLSISASWLVIAIVLARLVLKNAPKALHCALWALVAVRLLCPISFESDMSLIPSREVIPEHYVRMEPSDSNFDAPARLEIVTNPVYSEALTIETETTVDRFQNWDLLATVIWLAGVGVMAIYAIYSYLSIRLRVSMAGWVSGRVWECDELDSPFILGLLRPRIYLPSGLDEGTRSHVLAHENAHLKRLDHIWKPLGFALLSVHWFNPIMWLGYVLLCRDIELACDERVIRDLEKPQVRAYSEALVSCAVSQRRIAMCPLAFGEVGVKGRIKSMLNYRKPGFWVMVAAIAVSIAVAACFLTDPVQKPDTLQHIREEDGCTITSQSETTVTVHDAKALLPDDVMNGKTHSFEPGEIVLYQSDATTIYIESARMSGDELLLIISFDYEIGESGILILPYRVENGGREWTAQISELNGSVRIREFGPDPAITVAIKAEKYQSKNTIFFMLENMNRLTYKADHLIAAEEALPRLEAIKREKGYNVRWCQEQTLSFMFYTHWLPAGFESGHDFTDGELVVAETETTKLQMVHAELDGEQYRFDFAFTYDLPASGTILTPCHVDIKGVTDGMRLDPDMTYDYTRSYTGGVTLEHEKESERFTLLVDKELYEGLDDYISVTLEDVHAVTYEADDMSLPFEDYLVIRERYVVGTFERFLISTDLHLIGCEPEILFPIERDLGALHLTTLEDTPVSEKLKKDNLYAWRCEAYGRAYLLLKQEDGKLYVLELSEDGSSITDQYRIEKSNDSRNLRDAEVVCHSYSMSVTDTFDVPYFALYSDGTFRLHSSAVSSYIGFGSYTLTDKRLVLKTADGQYVWSFDVKNGSFAYDAELSSPIRYMKALKETAQVPDGALFHAPENRDYDLHPLEQSVEEAISAAVISHNLTDSRMGSICYENHRVLAELAVCGVATEDGGAPMEELIVYLYAVFLERSTDGEELFIEKNRYFPAKVSFAMTENGYELVEYRELTNEEAEADFPAFAWADLEQNRDVYETELSWESRKTMEARLADMQDRMAYIGTLFDMVSSSPAHRSDPGAYIGAHPGIWDSIMNAGSDTVHYCFRQLAVEQETGLRAYLMALACQEIIKNWGEDCVIEEYYNGENWFSQFAQHADTATDRLGWKEIQATHPGCALSIIYTDYQEMPPP